MRLKKAFSSAVGPLIVLQLFVGCKTTGLEPLKNFADSYDYTLYVPPRANHGPGWTFQFVKTFDGRTVPQTLCENLYPEVAVSDGTVSFPRLNTTSTLDVDFAVELLEGIIDSVGQAKANLKAKNIDSLNIGWKKARNHELPQDRLFDGQGKPLPISPACGSKLREIKKAGGINGVFVVYDAIYIGEMAYAARGESQMAGNIDLSLKELLTIKPGAKVSNTSSSELEIQEPRYVAFRAIALTDFVPTGLLGGEIAQLSGRKLSRQEIIKLLE